MPPTGTTTQGRSHGHPPRRPVSLGSTCRRRPRSSAAEIAVRGKRFSSSCGFEVSHQCIRPLIGACAPGHHGYQRACVLITGQASSGPLGSPVFASAGKTVPPSLLILSRTSTGNRMWCYVIACSLSVQFLCSCQEAVPSSRPAVLSGRRAQGPSSLAVALTSPVARRFQPGLDGTEHGATLKQVGASSSPVPASYASGAGARPDDSITCRRRCSGMNAIRISETLPRKRKRNLHEGGGAS
jgi:hypothetical protein